MNYQIFVLAVLCVLIPSSLGTFRNYKLEELIERNGTYQTLNNTEPEIIKSDDMSTLMSIEERLFTFVNMLKNATKKMDTEKTERTKRGISFATQTSGNRAAIKERVTKNMESKNSALKKRNKLGNLMGNQGMQTAGLGQLLTLSQLGGGMIPSVPARINPQAQYKKSAISNNMLRTGTQISN